MAPSASTRNNGYNILSGEAKNSNIGQENNGANKKIKKKTIQKWMETTKTFAKITN